MIIVPLVFSFLTDGCGRYGIVGHSDDDDNEDGYDYKDQQSLNYIAPRNFITLAYHAGWLGP